MPASRIRKFPRRVDQAPEIAELKAIRAGAVKAAKGSKSAHSPRNTLNGVTLKQEAFCQAIAAGMTYSDAYRHAYDIGEGTKPSTIHVNASQLLTKRKRRTKKNAGHEHGCKSRGTP